MVSLPSCHWSNWHRKNIWSRISVHKGTTVELYIEICVLVLRKSGESGSGEGKKHLLVTFLKSVILFNIIISGLYCDLWCTCLWLSTFFSSEKIYIWSSYLLRSSQQLEELLVLYHCYNPHGLFFWKAMLLFIYVYACVSVYTAIGVSYLLVQKYSQLWAALYGCWESNSDPLQDQYAL